MEFDPTVEEGLRRSNARFMASMNRIFEMYNHPFEDDILISMDSLTYETPDGPKKWDTVSRKDIKKWKKGFTQISPRPRSTEKQSRDFEDKHSAAHQESSENSGADTSDSGEESGAVASVGRKFEGIRPKNLNVDDGQILEKKIVPVDVILQGDERNYPKWITITTPRSSKSRHSTSPGQELLGPKKWDTVSRKDIKKWKKGFTQISPRPRSTEKQSRDFEDKHSAAHQESSENSGADTSDSGEESGAVASVGRKFEGIRPKNLNVDDGQILEKKIVPVDVILQGDERNYPKWITITTPRSSKSRHSTSPGQELLGPKKWDTVSRKDIKKWKKGFTQISPRPRSTEKQSRDFEDKHSAAHQESSENSGADTSDSGEESGAVASVGRKFEGIRPKNLNVDDGQILEKKIVPVDVILQGDERNYPKWITITTPRSSKSRHSTSPGQELLGPKKWDTVSRKDIKKWKKGFTQISPRPRSTEKQSRDFEDKHSAAHQESSENSGADTSDSGEESGAVASVGRKFEGIRPKNLNVDDGQILEKKIVPVDVILQGDERNYPKWITITTPRSSKSRHSTSPGQELLGPKKWDTVSRKDIKKWKKGFTQISPRPRSTEKQSRDFEDKHSAAHQESSENSGADTSDSGEESGAVASVGRKFEGIRPKNLNVDDGQILEKKIVPVDVILQGDERNYPKWITITTPRSSKSRHSTSPGQELLGPKKWDTVSRKDIKKWKKGFTQISPRPRSTEKQSRDFEDKHSAAHQESSENSGADTSDSGEESGAVASVGRKFEGIRPKNLNVDDGQILEKKIVPVDVILQGDERNYPKWITITTPRSSKSRHSTSPGQELLGNRSICRKRLEFSNECSSSKYPQLQHSAVPISSNTVASPWHQPRPELSTTSCDSILGEYQSADEECSLSSTTLLGLYPAMVALLTKLMTKRSQRKVLKYMFGHLSSKRRHSRRPKRNVTVDKMRGFGKASGKSQGVCKHSAFPDVMDRIGETFLVEDKLQTTDSPKNLEYTEDEKFTYKHFSEPSFITSTASSDSRAFHLVKEKTYKTDFHVGTSELCSSACSSHGNRNNSIPTTNCSPARSSNTMFIYPQKATSFQHKESLSSQKQNSSRTDKEIDAAFDELCYRVISGEYLKPLTLTRPLINSQNLKEKGTLVKSNRSDSERSLKQCDIEFEKLFGKSIPRSPGLQTASNFRKYEEIQIPETVNALVNSPVRTYSAISSVKRAGNFQNHPLCSPVKRLKFIPGHCFSSSKCQEISHSKEGNLQTGGMKFLSTYNCSKPSFFADHSCHCQGSGSHDSSHQSFLGIPGTSLQESGTAGAHSGWPGAMENCSSLRNVSKRHPRISRKLSYTDGKDQLQESLG